MYMYTEVGMPNANKQITPMNECLSYCFLKPKNKEAKASIPF